MTHTVATEHPSHYDDLDTLSTDRLLSIIHAEDKKVAECVESQIPMISDLIGRIVESIRTGGRLFYLGAGTSGRLGVLDASECPPTFGVPPTVVVGLIAGGDTAIRTAVEGAEDDDAQGWKDLLKFNISSRDVVVGIAASGRTPYVVGALRDAKANGCTTACITSNPEAVMIKHAHYPIITEVGPEVVTGSTRMKSGTAHKMVLNMISTATMVHLGKVKGNKMVDMSISNTKLHQRAIRFLKEDLEISTQEAEDLIRTHKSVRAAIAYYQSN